MIKKNISLPLNKNYNYFFSFITTSWNQSEFIKKNLNSIRNQKYKNYKVYYVNDGSTDNTKNVLNKYISKYPDFNIEIIHLKNRNGPCYARKEAYTKTNDSDICVFLDGDDFLIRNNVLEILAEAYDTNDVYATFGSFKLSTDGDSKWQNRRMIKYNRNAKDNYFPHLRTVKSFILKKIPDNYLKDKNNEWFMVKTDVALFTAVVELCGDKYMFILNKLAIYNVYNSNNNKKDGFSAQDKEHKLRRIEYDKHIKSMKKLEPYNNKLIEGFSNYNKIYLILFLIFNLILIFVLFQII